MNRKIRKTAIPIVCLLIYVFTIPASLSSHVLCVGADGHIEFESAINGRCTDAQANAWEQSQVAFTAVASEEHCGSCLDILIFASNNDQQFVVPAKNTYPGLSISTIAVTIIQPITHIVVPTNNHLPDDSPRIHPTLISLRTTTLLI